MFQANAFRLKAFQTKAPPVPTVFQTTAFRRAAFQMKPKKNG